MGTGYFCSTFQTGPGHELYGDLSSFSNTEKPTIRVPARQPPDAASRRGAATESDTLKRGVAGVARRCASISAGA